MQTVDSVCFCLEVIYLFCAAAYLHVQKITENYRTNEASVFLQLVILENMKQASAPRELDKTRCISYPLYFKWGQESEP